MLVYRYHASEAIGPLGVFGGSWIALKEKWSPCSINMGQQANTRRRMLENHHRQTVICLQDLCGSYLDMLGVLVAFVRIFSWSGVVLVSRNVWE